MYCEWYNRDPSKIRKGQPPCISLGKAVSLPRHANHKLLALRCAGEPVAQYNTPKESDISNALFLHDTDRRGQK